MMKIPQNKKLQKHRQKIIQDYKPFVDFMFENGFSWNWSDETDSKQQTIALELLKQLYPHIQMLKEADVYQADLFHGDYLRHTFLIRKHIKSGDYAAACYEFFSSIDYCQNHRYDYLQPREKQALLTVWEDAYDHGFHQPAPAKETHCGVNQI